MWVVLALTLAAAAPEAVDPPYYTYSGRGEPPAELLALVPRDHELFDFGTGDLNGDGREDAALVLRKPDEAEGSDVPRPLLLLIRGADGRLAVQRRNDHVVYCHDCGGMMGDPYQGLEIGKGRLTTTMYGGSAWRWSQAYTFAYDAAKKDWFLERDESSSFHASDPDNGTRLVITREELGDVAIGSFDYDKRQKEEKKKWRVVAERARFYEQPDLKSTPRKGYVVKGDVVEGYYELRNFVNVSFTNRDGDSTNGFLLKKDLEALPATLAK
jgi:hypothetical protein